MEGDGVDGEREDYAPINDSAGVWEWSLVRVPLREWPRKNLANHVKGAADERNLGLGGDMAEAQEQLLGWLGMEAASKGAEVLAMVERRLPPGMIDALLELGLEQEEIDQVVLPTRRKEADPGHRQPLTVSESDRLIRLLRVLSLAERVYGSRLRALRWLRRPNGRLAQTEQDDAETQGRKPVSLLTTDIGARMVEELLLQIDEGYFIS